MAEKKGAKKGTKTSTKGLTAEERAALKETMEERSGKGEGESAVLAKIESMAPADRALAKRIHSIVKAAAPDLTPRTWYGMPAYAKDDKIVCFLKDAAKFKARYATLGFSDKAKLDEGTMWPNSYALTNLTAAEEAKIRALVKKAVS